MGKREGKPQAKLIEGNGRGLVGNLQIVSQKGGMEPKSRTWVLFV